MPKMVTEVIREDLTNITNGAKSDLEKIVNSQLVLTGASGFIGKWLSLSYLHARQELGGDGTIVLSARDTSKLRQVIAEAGFKTGFEYVNSDIRDFPANVIGDRSLVINAATPARESLNLSQPLEMFDIIVNGQRKLLDLCTNKVAVRFLFLSSGAVYGKQPTNIAKLSEKWTGAPEITDPSNSYHEGKRVAELLGNICSKNSSLEFVSARLFAFLAPFLPLNEHFAAGNFLRDASIGRDIKINSGGGSIRSYQYATDLCIDLWSLLNRGVSGESYNVGSDVETSILQLAEVIKRTTNSDIGIIVQGQDDESNVSRYVPLVDKCISISKRQSGVSLEVAIKRTSTWIKQHEGELK